MMGDIRTFSDALPVLAALNMTPEPAGNRLWRVGVHTLDKGGVIRFAREAAARQEKPMATDQGIAVVEAEVVEAPLTTNEQMELAQHEATIEQGLQTYIQVGQALAAIRNGRLYRASHGDFDLYVRERWGHLVSSRRHADRLIEASEVAENLGPIGLIPANEAQARALAPLPPEEQRQAMQAAVDSTPGGKPTAADIQREVDKIRPPAPKAPATRPSAGSSGGGGGAAARPAPAAAPVRPRDGDAEAGEIAAAAAPLPPMLSVGQPVGQPAGLPPMLSIGRAPASPDRQALMQVIAEVALLEAAAARARQKLEQLAAGQSLPATEIAQGVLTENTEKLLASPEFRLRSGLLALNIKEERPSSTSLLTQIEALEVAGVNADPALVQAVRRDLEDHAAILDDATYEGLASRLSAVETLEKEQAT